MEFTNVFPFRTVPVWSVQRARVAALGVVVHIDHDCANFGASPIPACMRSALAVTRGDVMAWPMVNVSLATIGAAQRTSIHGKCLTVRILTVPWLLWGALGSNFVVRST